MPDREDPPTRPQRVPRKPVSWPKLEALNWERDDPTEIGKNSMAKLEGAQAGGLRAVAEATADTRQATRTALRACPKR